MGFPYPLLFLSYAPLSHLFTGVGLQTVGNLQAPEDNKICKAGKTQNIPIEDPTTALLYFHCYTIDSSNFDVLVNWKFHFHMKSNKSNLMERKNHLIVF